MKEIELTQGKVAIVDDADYDYIVSYGKWRAMHTKGLWYATRTHYFDGTRSDIMMHRIIMSPKEGMWVDHKDHDGLNNQRNNLRVCTCSQNHANKKMLRANTSGYKGVSPHSYHGKWTVFCGSDYCGMFEDLIAAAMAYDKAAREKYGEFALTNF